MRLWRRRSTDDFSAEVEAHLAIEADRLMRERGLSEADARFAARREFGNVGAVKERFYQDRLGIWAEHVRRDVFRALRSLGRSPGFTVVVLITLALGIGSVTTIFSIVNTMVFRPLPYPDASRIFALSEADRGEYADFSEMSQPAIGEVRRASRSFERITASTGWLASLATGGESVDVDELQVDSAFFGVLAIHAERGRLFAPDDFTKDAPVVLLSDSLWRNRFNADEHLLGQTVRIGGSDRVVIGVLPPGFRYPLFTSVWVPLPERADAGGGARYQTLGKLRKGVSLREARAEMADLSRGLVTADSARFPPGMQILVRDGMLEGQQGLETAIFAAPFLLAALCVLLVACANISGLSRVRAAERRREMAIRASVGGTAGRLLAQNLTESLILALLGGALGALLSVWGVKLVIGLFGALPEWMKIGLDWRVLAFTFGLSVLATIAFGLSPAREAIRIDLVKSLKAGGDGITAGGPVRRGAWRQVAVELALALVLVVSTSMIVQKARALASADLGFPRDKILEASFNFVGSRYADGGHVAMRFAQDVATILARNPAVAATATRTYGGFLVSDSAEVDSSLRRARAGGSRDELRLILPDQPDRRLPEDLAGWGATVVSRDFQRVLGLTLERGRWFDSGDGARSTPVAVVGDALAKGLWPNADPLGKTIRLGTRGSVITVVGVVSDVWDVDADMPEPRAKPAVYLSDAQAMGLASSVLIRATGDAAPLTRLVAPAIHAVDPAQPIFVAGLLENREDSDIKDLLRPVSSLLGAFAFIALALALIGIYGVTAYSVAQRTREIGIRLALGARTSEVIRGVMRAGVRFIGIGLAVGLVLSLGAGQIIRFMLTGVAALDPVTYLLAAAGFGAVALLACYIPSRRAARVDPMIALRAD